MKRLVEKIESLNGKNYGLYKTLKGTYSFSDFKLTLDHVQGDPFARPSLAHVSISHKNSGFPMEWLENFDCHVPLGDFITRLLSGEFETVHPSESCSGNGGHLFIAKPGQQILPRSSVSFTSGELIARFRLGLPASGRRIMSGAAVELITGRLPTTIAASCIYQPSLADKVEEHLNIYRKQIELRKKVFSSGYIAFVPNGAKLPRESGQSDKPLEKGPCVAFQSPPECEVSFSLEDGSRISGMALKNGVTLIVGGGFHGKSTLLRALELGIYNHISGDGREFVCVPEETVKIKAENGRPVHNVNISPFINNLPQDVDTEYFSTNNASGSTSQAASIIEAIDAGAKVLLMDEDTCATNFMIRDSKMRRLISDEDEPITPYLSCVRPLHESRGVSSIMVLGGCGEYFHVATRVIGMKNYRPHDMTEEALRIARNGSTPAEKPEAEKPSFISESGGRRRLRSGPRAAFKDIEKVRIREMVKLQVGTLSVDVRHLEQLVSHEQLATLGRLMTVIFSSPAERPIDQLKDFTEEQKINVFSRLKAYNDGFAGVRYLDLVAVLNRCPELEIIRE